MKAEIQLDLMLIKGNYTLSSLFSKANGPFEVTLKNVAAKGNASIAVERDGKLRTQDISMDMTFSDLQTDFQNLGTYLSFHIHIKVFWGPFTFHSPLSLDNGQFIDIYCIFLC